MKQENDNFDVVFDEIADDQSGVQDMSPEEVRRKSHGADSMRGRLVKEEEKARQLEEKLKKKADEDQGHKEAKAPVPEKDEPPQATGDDQDGHPGPDAESPDESGQQAEKSEQDKEPAPETVSEEDRKKATEYELVVERLRAQQERNRQLEEMLKQQQAPQGVRQGWKPPAQAAKPVKPAKIKMPEELADDAREFQGKYPDYYAFLEEDSPAGRRMRDALRDYGPEQAALIGETRVLREEIEATRRDAHQKTSDLARKIQEDEARTHFGQLAQKHPEMAWKEDPARKKDWEAFIGNVYQWIETLPYRVAQQALDVANKGSTRQTLELLDTYKQAVQGSDQQGNAGQTHLSNPGPDQTPGGTAKVNPPVSKKGDQQARNEDKEKLIKAAEVIPSRPAPPRSPKPDPNDFESAWDEAVGDKR